MASERFEQALAEVLKHEGGYVNHPDDPGGATNKGITQATFDRWNRAHNLPLVSVRYIAHSQVCAIYSAEYWDKVAGDKLPSGLDYATFDYGVNSGPPRAVKALQRVVGTTPDGIVGPKTLQAVRDADTRTTIKMLCAERTSFLQALKHFKTFGKGWMRRVADVEAKALSWVTTKTALREEAAEAKNTANRQAGGAALGTGAGTVETVNPLLPTATNALVVGAILCLVLFLAYHAYRNRVRAEAIMGAADA